MMIYLWLALWGVLVMVVTTVVVSLWTRRYQAQNPGTQPVACIGGIVLAAVCFILATLYAMPRFLLPYLLLLFPVIYMILWTEIRLSGYKKELSQFGLCLLAVLCIPTDLHLFQAVPSLLAFLILGAGLYLIIRIFTFMDRVPSLSLTTLLTQGILLAMLAQLNIFPAPLLHCLFYAFVAAMSVCQTIKAFTGQAVFGPFAARVAGFIMGFLWIYTVAMGLYFVPVILFSYDIMELILAFCTSWIVARHIGPITQKFLLERAQATGVQPKKLNRYIFLILAVLALAAYTQFHEKNLFEAALLLTGLVLAAVYMKLKKWGVLEPSFRDLKDDLIAGLKELKTQMVHIPLKSDKSKEASPSKPISASRKTTKKKAKK